MKDIVQQSVNMAVWDPPEQADDEAPEIASGADIRPLLQSRTPWAIARVHLSLQRHVWEPCVSVLCQSTRGSANWTRPERQTYRKMRASAQPTSSLKWVEDDRMIPSKQASWCTRTTSGQTRWQWHRQRNDLPRCSAEC